MAKAKKAKGKSFAVLPNGEKHEITKDGGRFWVCGYRQFRKSSVTVEIEKEEAPKDGEPAEE